MKMIHTHTGVKLTSQHYDMPKDTIVYPIRHSVEEGCMLVTLDPDNTEVATNAPLRVVPISKLELLQR
jgi:hypothetical protein